MQHTRHNQPKNVLSRLTISTSTTTQSTTRPTSSSTDSPSSTSSSTTTTTTTTTQPSSSRSTSEATTSLSSRRTTTPLLTLSRYASSSQNIVRKGCVILRSECSDPFSSLQQQGDLSSAVDSAPFGLSVLVGGDVVGEATVLLQARLAHQQQLEAHLGPRGAGKLPEIHLLATSFPSFATYSTW